MKENKIVLISSSILALAILALAIVYALKPMQNVYGSVSQASEYHSSTMISAATAKTNETVKITQGTLGSYIVTVTGTAPLTIYNATTTDVTKRALATTSLDVLAYFGSSPTVGTYTYDIIATQGILAVYGTGTIASSSITWR